MTHYTQGNQNSKHHTFLTKREIDICFLISKKNRKQWSIFKVCSTLKTTYTHTNCEPRNLHSAKISLKNKSKKEEFLDKGKLSEMLNDVSVPSRTNEIIKNYKYKVILKEIINKRI